MDSKLSSMLEKAKRIDYQCNKFSHAIFSIRNNIPEGRYWKLNEQIRDMCSNVEKLQEMIINEQIRARRE